MKNPSAIELNLPQRNVIKKNKTTFERKSLCNRFILCNFVVGKLPYLSGAIVKGNINYRLLLRAAEMSNKKTIKMPLDPQESHELRDVPYSHNEARHFKVHKSSKIVRITQHTS